MVPKGFIRHQVLESLNQKSMSGSEIINEIEKKTNGHWKPSPGSIYPLLSWLQDNGHVRELPTDQNGMKRYELTESGKVLLDEQKGIIEEQRKRIDEQRRSYMNFKKHTGFVGPPFMTGPWFHFPSEESVKVRKSIRGLVAAFFELGENLQTNFSEQILEEAIKVLDETTGKIEELNKKSRSQK